MTTTGVKIPGYRTGEQIGSGAMAAVYSAIQVSLERQVALKIMSPSLMADESFCERFIKEGRIVGQLTHHNIVTVFDIGSHDNCFYMAMELIDGGTLKEKIQEGVTPKAAVVVLKQIAAALGYAHRLSFVHRDVKPANILFRSDGSAVLSDFGIAKSFGDGTQLTQAGWTVGTPNYMSPEQAMGQEVDGRSDIYALGVVFYEMLTGAKPYQSTDKFATALMHVNSPIPQLPPELSIYQGLLDRLLAKDPAERFPSGDALLQAVAEIRDPSSSRRRAADAEATKVIQAQAKPATKGFAMAAAIVPLFLIGAYLMWEQTPAVPNPTAEPIEVSTAPLNEETLTLIEGLLTTAELHLDVGNLASPPVSNAGATYQRVLELDPVNARAKAGLDAMAVALTQQVQRLLDKNEFARALDLTQAGISLHPGSKELAKIRSEIQKIIGE